MNKIIPLLIVIGCIGFVLKDVIPFTRTNSIAVDDKKISISDEMKENISDILNVIKSSNATEDKKRYASDLWRGAGDIWSTLDINVTSDKISLFNQDLFKIYSKHYDLSNSFKGFSEASNKVFSKIIGEYPKQMTKEDCVKMAELCYAISWAFEQ